jgi:putative serine protease PepD
MSRRPVDPWRRAPALGVLLTVAIALAACNASNATPGPTGSVATPIASPDAASSSGAPESSTSPSAPAGASGEVSAAASAAPEASSGTTSGGQPSTGGSTADSLEQTFETVVSTVSPSVVVIETTEGLGSGIVLDDQGDIVTNAHVVGSSKTFQIDTATGGRLDGTLVGTFPADDVAVVKAKGGNLRPATFGDSSKLRVGQIVLAIGNPLGLQSSVTDGIVSALGRTVNEPSGAALPNAIQTSAPINPGNSGGALVDLSSQVIGIPTLAATDPQMGGAAPGIGFAVPSNIAVDIAHQLVQDGRVVASHRAYLGIRSADVSGGQGALVFSLAPGGPAAKAGIPADVLITSIDGKPTPDSATLAAVLAELQPGQGVDVQYVTQDGTQKTVKVTLGELPG